MRARILGSNTQQAALDRAPDDSVSERSRDHLREQRDDFNLISSSRGQSTRIRPAARSTLLRCLGTAGIQYSRSPCTTIIGLVGVSTK